MLVRDGQGGWAAGLMPEECLLLAGVGGSGERWMRIGPPLILQGNNWLMGAWPWGGRQVENRRRDRAGGEIDA